MAAIVFLAPKNKTAAIAEEKASIPLDETEAIILKEYGDDLTLQEKEIVHEAIAEELALEKAEIKKRGQVLTDEERFKQEWQAEVKARQEDEFAKPNFTKSGKSGSTTSLSNQGTIKTSSLTRKTSRTVTKSSMPTERKRRRQGMRRMPDTRRKPTKSGQVAMK